MKRLPKSILQISLPFVLGFCLLWWMYRGTDWADFMQTCWHETKWGWMLLSLAFGVLPQLARAWRWRLALEPLGEHPRRGTCADAIFLSYATSLVVPRLGEVTRCGTLKKCDRVSFTHSIGTVVTERLVDSALMLLLAGLALLLQLPVFLSFLHDTGAGVENILGRFTGTGYLVTAVCVLLAALACWVFLRKIAFIQKGRTLLGEVWKSALSLRQIRKKGLYLFYSLLIWAGYFLHFYIAFFCFDYTAGIGVSAAFLVFCVGTFAVLVPTPNGAGPWHFAVKTMLVLYGVEETKAITFALVVHTIQTALVVVLGAFGWARIALRKSLPAK